jgi:hypothetical protein
MAVLARGAVTVGPSPQEHLAGDLVTSRRCVAIPSQCPEPKDLCARTTARQAWVVARRGKRTSCCGVVGVAGARCDVGKGAGGRVDRNPRLGGSIPHLVVELARRGADGRRAVLSKHAAAVVGGAEGDAADERDVARWPLGESDEEELGACDGEPGDMARGHRDVVGQEERVVP